MEFRDSVAADSDGGGRHLSTGLGPTAAWSAGGGDFVSVMEMASLSDAARGFARAEAHPSLSRTARLSPTDGCLSLCGGDVDAFDTSLISAYGICANLKLLNRRLQKQQLDDRPARLTQASPRTETANMPLTALTSAARTV